VTFSSCQGNSYASSWSIGYTGQALNRVMEDFSGYHDFIYDWDIIKEIYTQYQGKEDKCSS
jgi:hypothetical protein